MNVLFISLGGYKSVHEFGIYTDLLREFIKNGDDVFILSPTTKPEQDTLIHEEHCTIVRVMTGRITKTNIIEKGINTILIEYRLIKAIKKHLGTVKFDLVLYPTPPITFAGVVEYIKKRDGAKTYLLLKDIFPQNAVDIGMLSKNGLKGLIYRYFRKKEKKLYALSDQIGCMSKANCEYVIRHNPWVDCKKVDVCPNSVEPRDMSVTQEQRTEIRNKYGIPLDKKVFVYGGNLGKPQGIPHIIDCLRSQSKNDSVFFLIVGGGTEYGKLEAFVNNEQPSNVKLLKRLPKEDYDRMVAACDVGMIFLDHRFTIPNFPSRLLSYMQAKLPVLACTDKNTDIGKVITDGGFGWWCESNEVENFAKAVKNACCLNGDEMGQQAWLYLNENFTASKAKDKILESISCQ